LIDASASMGQCDTGRPDYSRLEAAKAMAAAIAELAMQQGDRFGFMALGDGGLTLLPPATGLRQRDRLLLELLTVRPARGFAPESQLGPVWERIGAHDLVLLLSDCFDEGAVALAEKLSAAGRETLLIEMLTVAERDFPFEGGYRFRDPETGEELLADGAALRAEFLARCAACSRPRARRNIYEHGPVLPGGAGRAGGVAPAAPHPHRAQERANADRLRRAALAAVPAQTPIAPAL
jgi:uncharacterized protein (DUF58 family)